jgi:hypothetical protein
MAASFPRRYPLNMIATTTTLGRARQPVAGSRAV